MYNVTKPRVVPAVLASALILSPWAVYGGQDKAQAESMSKQSTNALTLDDVRVNQRGEAIMMTSMIGKPVKDNQGKNVGEVEDVVMDRTGRITHAIIAQGGILGINEEKLALPWEVFELTKKFITDPNDDSLFNPSEVDRPLLLRVSSARLEGAPRVGDSRSLTPPNPTPVLKQVDEYFKQEILNWHEKARQESAMPSTASK